MKPLPLDIERIDDLALELAMRSAQQAPDLVFSHSAQFRAALISHQRSCRPIPLARRFVYATVSARPQQFMHLVRRQRTMLRLAADDGSELTEICDALMEVESAHQSFFLGQNPTHKQKLGWQVCQIPDLQIRYAALVRNGEVADAPVGLRLQKAQQRRRAAYLLFALIVGWEWFVFITMAIRRDIGAGQLIAYMIGALLFSLWLTRGLFVALRADQRTLDEVNEGLHPQGVAGKSRG